jgi:hypothetical protein
MKATADQIKRFYEMVEGFAEEHHIHIMHGADPNKPGRYIIRVEAPHHSAWKEYIVEWDGVKSLTDAATRIFVDIIVEFKLNNEAARYCKNDIDTTRAACHVYRRNEFEPTRVIFNDPATIVFWPDGTKTVVKCQPGEEFDEMMGLAMAISKKALGNEGNYNNVFRKWVPAYTEEQDAVTLNQAPMFPPRFESAEFRKAVEDMINRMIVKRRGLI